MEFRVSIRSVGNDNGDFSPSTSRNKYAVNIVGLTRRIGGETAFSRSDYYLKKLMCVCVCVCVCVVSVGVLVGVCVCCVSRCAGRCVCVLCQSVCWSVCVCVVPVGVLVGVCVCVRVCVCVVSVGVYHVCVVRAGGWVCNA